MKKQAQKTTTKPTKPAKAGGLAATVAAATKNTPTDAPKPKPVALRGGLAVAKVTLEGGKKYNTQAKHNVEWLKVMADMTAKAPAAVADVIAKGVPSHFIGYCLRRGYAVAADK